MGNLISGKMIYINNLLKNKWPKMDSFGSKFACFGLIFLLFCIPISTFAQSFYPDFKTVMGSISSDAIPLVTSDINENIYLAQQFSAEPIIESQHFPNVYPKVILISKMNPYGEIVWSQNIESNSFPYVYSLKCKNGFVYCAGTFYDTLFYYNSSNTLDLLISKGKSDIFVFKYTVQGEFVDALSIGDTNYNYFTEMDVINNDYIFCGYFTSNLHFRNENTGEDFTLEWNGSEENDKDIFLIRLDEDGNCIWAKRAGGMYSDDVYGMSVYNNEIYLTGLFRGTANFNTPSQNGANTVQAAGTVDMFLAKFDQYGNPHWVKRAGSKYTDEYGKAGSSNHDYGSDVEVNQNGVFVTGQSYYYCNFNTPFDDDSNTILDEHGCFLAHYDFDGTFLWAKDLKLKYLASHKLKLSLNQNYIGLLSLCRYPISLYSYLTNDSITFPTPKSNDCFVSFYDFNGNFLNGNSFGYSGNDQLGNIVLTNYKIYVTSRFQYSVFFNNGIQDIDSLSSIGSFDGLLLRYSIPYQTSDTITPTVELKVFPNPATDYIYLSVYPELTTPKYSIFDVLGRAVESGTVDNFFKQINVKDYKSGIYIIRVYSKSPKTLRFIKN